MAASLTKPTPMMFLFLGLGLAVIGILSHPRRARGNQRQNEWRDNQDEYSSFNERQEDLTARDYGPGQPRAGDVWPAGTGLSVSRSGVTGVNNERDKNEVNKRDDRFAQLRQEYFDRLLQSEGERRPLPSRDTGQNTDAGSFRASPRIDGQAQGEALRKALGLI
jgi:hypothetical protein